MLKQESNESVVTWPRGCDSCRSAACALYCEADSAYLCTTCDTRIHAANPVASRHHRVRICQSCESSPASYAAASLCAACYAEIHPANPLATEDEEDQEVASWLLLNPVKSNGFLFGVEYLDLADYSSSMDNQFEDQYSQYQRDGVVPLQGEEDSSITSHRHHNFQLDAVNYGYSSGAKTSDITFQQYTSTPKDAVEQLPCGTLPQQLTPMDREARVLRYREKKKTRKFEKTIRYASRKAYAEIRPRIKGRFAKRIETETADSEQPFSYGIVPSF